MEYDEDISEIPEAILTIPFVGNMLALGMVFDTEIKVKELDQQYYEAIPRIIHGYQELYKDKGKNCCYSCCR